MCKKIKMLFLGLCATLLASCSSDDDSGTSDGSAVVGTWKLTEIVISIAQDPNMDGTASTNMLEELDCFSGTITVKEDGTWTSTATLVNITSVTGDFYVVDCGGTAALGGRYTFENNQLNLNSSGFSKLTLNGDTLSEQIGEDLPGIRYKTYERQ